MNVSSINTEIASNVIPAKVTALSNEFNAFAQKTAEGVLSMALTVCKAKALSKNDFALFCDLIRYDPKSSAIRKLAVIGAKHTMLSQHVGALPSTWTTIYRIAEMDGNKLGDAVSTGKIHPTMTAKMLEALCGPSISKRKISPPQTVGTVPNGTTGDIIIRLAATPNDADLQTIRLIRDLLEKIKAECQLSDNLTTALQEAA